MNGIDVSKHNGAVNWTSAATAIDFAIIRAGYGKTYVDPWFERHLAGAQAAGLRVGVYHYSYALTIEDARAEARHLLDIINGRKFDMPLWFDMEDADGYKKKNGTVPGVTGKVDTNVLYTEFWKKQEQEEEMKVYTHTDQMPDWAQSTFRRLIDAEIVKVDAKGEINVEHSALQPMVYLDRLCDGHVEQLLKK